MRNFIAIVAALLLAVMFVPAWANQNTGSQSSPGEAMTEGGNSPNDQSDMPASQKLSDGEIAAFIAAVNEHEISAANAATQKNVGGEVAEYIQKLNQDHSQNQEKLEALDVNPSQSAAVERFKQQGKQELSRLDQLSGNAFTNAFVAAMVKDHTKVLNMIDSQFMTSVKDTELRDHLKATRASVSDHLEHAKRLQGSMKNQ